MTDAITLLGAGLTGAVAAGSLAVALFRRLRMRQAEIETRTNKRQQTLHAELGRLRGEIQAIRTRAEESERRAAATAAPRHLLSGLNVSHRTQALRLLRKGDSPEKVASILGVPQSEIELLAKVQRLLAVEGADSVPSARQTRAAAAK